jgi:glycogen(starch) synthase
VKVVLASEIYPPRAGGAGWSTRALALSLKEAGHDVSVLTTSAGPDDLDGIVVKRLHAAGRRRFAVPRAFLGEIRALPNDVLIHAQHSLAALGALASRRASRVVVTVRDHWPLCFWSTRISRGSPCPACGLRPMSRCIKGHVSVPPPFAWALIPYMRWDLGVKRSALQRAGGLIAVSEPIAAELRGAGLGSVEVIPNIVDPRETRICAESPPLFPLPDRFLLFIGKLETNKGAHLLIPAVAAAATGLPLIVLGEGSLARQMKHDALAADVPLSMRGWVHRQDVLRVLARATALVFPSLWDEPLSRVLLEAQAVGTPVAAMATGGTREIVVDEETGLVVAQSAGLGPAIARIVQDDSLRSRLTAGARARASAFAPEALVPRYESLYRRVLAR